MFLSSFPSDDMFKIIFRRFIRNHKPYHTILTKGFTITSFLYLGQSTLCRITVPILWEDPFSVRRQEDCGGLLDTCILFFDDDDKAKLKEFGITIHSPPLFKKPIFTYPNFIKKLDTFRVKSHITNWINGLDNLPNSLHQGTNI